MSQPNLFPAIRYRNATAAIDWLVNAFGFEKQFVAPGPDGTIGHAQIRLGTGVLMLSTAGAADPNNPWTTVPAGVYAAVSDPDAHHARARAAGAAVVMPPADMDYGAREYSVRDCEGNLWAFGTYNPSPEGPQDLFPALRYRDGRRAIDWLCAAFGFTTRLEVPGPEGAIAHAELELGPGILMLGSSPDDPATNPWAGARQGTCVAIGDVDAHCARAKAAGARVLQQPQDTPYGSRGYTALDLEGHLWTFGTYRP